MGYLLRYSHSLAVGVGLVFAPLLVLGKSHHDQDGREVENKAQSQRNRRKELCGEQEKGTRQILSHMRERGRVLKNSVRGGGKGRMLGGNCAINDEAP